MSRVDYGQIDIDLGGEVYTLKPTLAAMQKIDRHFGSIREAIVQAGNLSLTAAVVIIAAGAGLGTKQTQDLPERIFAAGLLNVAGPISEFLGVLMNPSGRSSDEGDGEGKP